MSQGESLGVALLDVVRDYREERYCTGGLWDFVVVKWLLQIVSFQYF